VSWKKVVIGAVLGGLLGFGGQFLADGMPVNISEKEMSTLCWLLGSPGMYEDLSVKQKHQAQPMIYQACFWMWLEQRCELASRTALLVAFLGVSIALALDQKGRTLL
jgi:hypothetical protein